MSFIRAQARKVLLMWLERRAKALYEKYHASFNDYILEAQEQHRLPVTTHQIKQRLNAVIREIRKIDPDHPVFKRELH